MCELMARNETMERLVKRLSRLPAGPRVTVSKTIGAVLAFAIAGCARAEDRTYDYLLEIDRDAALCEHMSQVFNALFRQPWRDEMDVSFNAANGKFSFPRLPWVEHSDRITVDMRFSKLPTSPEFDAISWQEGRAIVGTADSGGNTPIPVLIAYFDFDNDGHADTVMKDSFMTHYQYRAGLTNARGPEYLLVWRGERRAFDSMPSMWELQNEVPKDKRPVLSEGLHQRPFIYRGQTYVARYQQDWGSSKVAGEIPWYPLGETMSIVRYALGAKTLDSDDNTRWMEQTVCEFQMKPVASHPDQRAQ